jgi:hypothetical protein
MGRVWLGHVDPKIESIDELDPRVYQTTMKLIRLGAKLEIGKGPEDFEKGIYCTNLTYPQVLELINKKEERLLPGEIDKINELFKEICEYSKEYYQAKQLGDRVIIAEDNLHAIESKYEETILPKIFMLSPPARKILKDRIKARLFNLGSHIKSDVYEKTIEDMEDTGSKVFG